MAKELNKFILSAIAIIGLTVVVLVGMAVSANFSKVLRVENTVNSSVVQATTLMTLVINESIAVGSTGTYPFLQTLTGCLNSSNDALSTSYYEVNEGDKDGGLVTLNQDGLGWDGVGINCSNLVYLANTDGQAAADKFTTGLATFGTFAVIIILAIVGKAIIGLFKRKD